MGKRHQVAKRAQDFFPDATGRKRVVFRDVFPNIGDVLRGERVKGKSLFGTH
jgi:hypothetical protein